MTFAWTEIFNGLATLTTGGVAWLVYYRQKKDFKVQAARVLLTEIRIAEERIDKIRENINNNLLLDLPLVFVTKNWKKYAYLFISDFDTDELKLINVFYESGERVEEFV